MQLSDVLSNAIDQDKGADLDLIAPWDGKPTGMVLTIAGPDSVTARKADIAFADELADMAGPDGRVDAENRAKARLNALARRVIRWDVKEGGKPVPFNTKSVLALLGVAWVRDQVDQFAGDHTNYRPVA
ncbi:hypothetical protein PSQ90_07770 [Devosia rhodophyticola]|uniref:Uncharacterized protein n=1 Tax=Devosia rhodophyticola TaxID=3026423 RepID=A0ABY7Z197_9HYPH|nr:hypothetical protein [Devosia rhodophyticola]WDR07306.1 hypothetical protein PSQ90_07770 [Devosia rhodophyticola]